MRDAPIVLTLQLWSLGHNASDISEKLGFPNAKHVTRIIRQARRLRDPRAVLHCYPTGRVVGNLRKAINILADWPELQVVEMVSRPIRKVGEPPWDRKVWSQRRLARANGLPVMI